MPAAQRVVLALGRLERHLRAVIDREPYELGHHTTPGNTTAAGKLDTLSRDEADPPPTPVAAQITSTPTPTRLFHRVPHSRPQDVITVRYHAPAGHAPARG